MVIEVSERLNWSSISENELVLLVQKNQGEAFVELASRYFPLIHRIAYPYRSALLEAEDLSQEGLLGLYYAARTFRQTGGASFSTYAGVCISNCIVSAFRRAFSRSGQIMKEAVPLDREADLAAIQDPESQLIDRENLDVLLHKIRNTLTRMEQQVLSCYVSGFSYQEISSALGISVKSVGNAMQRVRKKLRNAV